jgi:hypothetical protein
MQAVIETPRYLADAERLFSAEEREAIVDLVARDPHCGVVIPGGGSIRKVRVGFGGRGKRGGARVLYMFGGMTCRFFCLQPSPKTKRPI